MAVFCRRASTLGVNGWETIVGLEVHAQLKSGSKLFSKCSPSRLEDVPNSQISLFDVAFPGTLPIANTQCVALATRLALALDAQIQPKSTFDRKHYFYPDLPSGYQITQKYAPFALGGSLVQKGGNRVRIKQLQLEQDTGKSHSETGSSNHAVDFNRAGSALIEIVSEPDLRSAENAAEYLRSLQVLIRGLRIGNARMEDGSLRCDVNVSVRRQGEAFGPRCEIKNLNSVKSLVVAINSEVVRQIDIIRSGHTVQQETRGFDELRTQTYSLRGKEDAPDYRYLPDPNLAPLSMDQAFIEHMRQIMPELPDALRARLQHQYGLSSHVAGAILGFEDDYNTAARYYEQAVRHGNPASVANWIINELWPNVDNLTSLCVSPEQLGRLAQLVHSREVTYASGRHVLNEMLQHPTADNPEDIVIRLNLQKVTNSDDLEYLCRQCIAQLPNDVDSYRNGNERVLNKLVGYTRRLSKGTADPVALTYTLRSLIAKNE